MSTRPNAHPANMSPASPFQLVSPLLCAALLAACGGQFPEEALPEVGSSSAAIVNGSLDFGHPTVGTLSGGAHTCTATLVGKRTLVTAAHCIMNVPASSLRFSLGNQNYAVASATAHPSVAIDSTAVRHDVAVVALAGDALADLMNVQPVPLANVGAVSGTQVEVVGMGRTDDPNDNGGSKRTTKNVVGRIDAWSYSLTAPSTVTGSGLGSFCQGDSGGPSFATLQGKVVQVGIHSFLSSDNEDGLCSDSEGYDFRIDQYLDWIEGAAVGDVETAGLGALPAGALPTSASGSEAGDATRNEYQAVACNASGSRSSASTWWAILGVVSLLWSQRRRGTRTATA